MLFLLPEVDLINPCDCCEEKCKPIIIRVADKALHFVFPGTPARLGRGLPAVCLEGLPAVCLEGLPASGVVYPPQAWFTRLRRGLLI
jgi:hypothetical protein